MRDRCGLLFQMVAAWGILLSLAASGAACADPPASEPGRVSFPTYGVSFVPPPGWVAETWPSLPNIMNYAQLDKDHHLLAELTIQSNETPPFERHKLEEFAIMHGAEVLVQPFAIDAAPATAVRKTEADEKNGTFLMLVADHDSRSYTFSVSAPTASLPTHELITMIKTVHWISVEEPLDHLEPSQKASLFDNAAEIRMPAIFRKIPNIKVKNVGAFVATDASSKQIASISFRFIPADDNNPGIPDDAQVLTVRRTVLEAAQKQWGLSDFPLIDTKEPIAHGVATTPTVVSSLSSDAKMLTATSRYGALFAAQGITYFQMQSFGDPSERTAKWDKTLLDIANSLKFAPASASQPVSH